MKTQTAKRQPPTPGQVIAEQKRRAAKDAAKPAPTSKAVVPAKPDITAVATPDARTDVQKYLDDIAPAGIVGRLIKFSKDGKFVSADDDEPVDEAAEFIALCDQTLIGWIRFHNDGETPPDRVMGCSTTASKCRRAQTLGDTDESRVAGRAFRRAGRSVETSDAIGAAATETRELFTFVDHRRRPAAVPSATCSGTTTVCNATTPTSCRSCGCAPAVSITRQPVSAGCHAGICHRRSRAARQRREAGHQRRRRPQRSNSVLRGQP